MGGTIAALWITIVLALIPAARADWPEAPWINGSPTAGALITAVAFVSPMDLQFYRIMHDWRKLQKKYGSANVDFLVVAMQEPLLPFNEFLVRTSVSEAGYGLPVLVDETASYAKLWRAYVSPTVNLVMREGKVTSFDPGDFDPSLFEKTLQRLLKENGITTLPAREYPNENETKGCGHSETYFLGNRFQKAWGKAPVNLQSGWGADDYWIVKDENTEAKIEIPLNRASLGLIAQVQKAGQTSRVNVSLDGQKIPPELRGLDILEDKSNGSTYFLVKGPRMYEILVHSAREKESGSKLSLTTDSKGVRIWAVQTLPYCEDPAL